MITFPCIVRPAAPSGELVPQPSANAALLVEVARLAEPALRSSVGAAEWAPSSCLRRSLANG
jgi:hypothetical protein